MSATTLDVLKEVYTRNFSHLIECGISKPPTCITFEDKIGLVQSLTLHHAILKAKAEIDQFAEGLTCLGTKNYICKHPQLLKKFFTIQGRQPLTAGKH